MPNVYFVVDNQTPVSITVQFFGYRGQQPHFHKSMDVAPWTESRLPHHDQTTALALEHGYRSTWIIMAGPNREKPARLGIRPGLDHHLEIDIAGRETGTDVTCRLTASNYANEQADVK